MFVQKWKHSLKWVKKLDNLGFGGGGLETPFARMKIFLQKAGNLNHPLFLQGWLKIINLCLFKSSKARPTRGWKELINRVVLRLI